MDYRIEVCDRGALVGTIPHGGSRESAITTARIKLRQHQRADIVRIVDAKGLGAEDWSERRDHVH